MPLTVEDSGRELQVRHDGAPLLAYVYRSDVAQLESPRPYFHPVRTLAGDTVTLYRPHDHVWHKGIAWSLPEVGGHNFWGGPNYVHEAGGYVQQDNDGSMDHDGFTSVTAEGARAAVTQRLTWHSQAGQALVSEERSFAVDLLDDATYVLTFATAMTNTSGRRLDIGSPTTKGRDNAGYGGLFWRGPRDFTGGAVLASDASDADEARGRSYPWMGFLGQHDGSAAWSSLLMVDDPANPHHPPQWFVRSHEFAALCPAPFFSVEVPFDDGETLRFRYAVVVHAGRLDSGGAAQLAARAGEVLTGDGS